MSELLVWREKLQEFYAKWSIYIDKAIQFILAFVSFYVINQNIGLMKSLATPLVTLALAVICTFLPPVFTALAAAILVVAHLLKLSLGVMGVAALIFLIMFIFYCRFTPKKALLLLVTPIGFLIHVPYIVPIVCALVMGPAASIPVVLGTIVYYMIVCVKNSATAIANADGIAVQVSLFVKAVFQNKNLWITVVAFVICVFTVYAIRRLEVDHAWKLAVTGGAVVNIIVIVIGDIAFDIHTSYGILIWGNILGIVVGIVMEFFLFSVDYTRAERLQFEDDEYYYYVKAIPKVSVTPPEKRVKRINERRDSRETDRDEGRRKGSRGSEGRKPVYRNTSAGQTRRTAAPKKSRVTGNTEELLLAKSLREELDIQNIVERELEDK